MPRPASPPVPEQTTPAATPAPAPGSGETPKRDSPFKSSRIYRLLWADLLKKVFAVDVLACPDCGGRLKLIAFTSLALPKLGRDPFQAPESLIAGATVACRILDHLGLDSQGPPVARAQAPPELFDPEPDYDVARAGSRAAREVPRGAGLDHDLLRLSPGARDALLLRGHARYGMGDWAAAVEAYAAARAMKPKDPAAMNYQALATERAGDAATARRLMTDAIAAGADRGRLLFERADLEAVVGHPEAALKWLDAALAAGFRDRAALADLRSVPGCAAVCSGTDCEHVGKSPCVDRRHRDPFSEALRLTRLE